MESNDAESKRAAMRECRAQNSPVMTMATNTDPTSTARHDSHQVKPSSTKDATVAHDAG